MIYLLLCLLIAFFPALAFAGAAEGVKICQSAIIPSLFPFIFAATLLIRSGFARPLGAALSPVFSRLFGISGLSGIAFVNGLLGGYPCGAAAAGELYAAKDIDKNEAERLLAFCNNSGPIFVISTVGLGAFGSLNAGILLYVSHIFGAVFTAIVLRRKGSLSRSRAREEFSLYKKNRPGMGGLLHECMQSSALAMLSICGFIIFFSALIKILSLSRFPFFAGLLEMTSGVFALARAGGAALPAAAFLVSWGGLSVHFQTLAILSKHHLGCKKYFLGKFIGAFASSFFCAAVYRLFPRAMQVSGGKISVLFEDPYLFSLALLLAFALMAVVLCLFSYLHKEKPSRAR